MNAEHPLSPLRALRRAIGALAYKTPLYDMTLRGNVPTALAFLPPDPWPGDAAAGRAITSGQLRISGAVFPTRDPAALWRMEEGMDDSALAALHGFSWLHDLRTASGDEARQMARALISSWIDSFGSWHEKAWRPDILARRISMWISLHDFYCASADDAFRGQVFLSLTQQLRHLSRAAADCPPGAPCFAVIKALAYGGLCFEDEEARLIHALRLLEGELRAQVLADGGHVSRNPALLLASLIDLIDLRTALRAARKPVPETLTHAIERMAPALRFFRHGDGGLALFNGASEGNIPLIELALTQADSRNRPIKSASASHFERMHLGRTLILADTGATPRNPAAAGAHAGTFSFEMSIGRERLITNCGSTALPGEWPLALRGTAAHSTLIMADINSSSIMPGSRKPASTQVKRTDGQDDITLEGSHDGYKSPLGTIHTRSLRLAKGGDELAGEDTLTGHPGQPFTIRFHLHPDVHASTLTGGDILLRLPSGMGWRFHAEGAPSAIEDSVYFGNGGEARKTKQIAISGTTNPKETRISWCLAHEGRKAKAEASG